MSTLCVIAVADFLRSWREWQAERQYWMPLGSLQVRSPAFPGEFPVQRQGGVTDREKPACPTTQSWEPVSTFPRNGNFGAETDGKKNRFCRRRDRNGDRRKVKKGRIAQDKCTHACRSPIPTDWMVELRGTKLVTHHPVLRTGLSISRNGNFPRRDRAPKNAILVCRDGNRQNRFKERPPTAGLSRRSLRIGTLQECVVVSYANRSPIPNSLINAI